MMTSLEKNLSFSRLLQVGRIAFPYSMKHLVLVPFGILVVCYATSCILGAFKLFVTVWMLQVLLLNNNKLGV